ncbi:MAG TPA: PLDc N-terminal domain-containing protein [Candidatus Dojkabacteria bacterium]|nr:PLDc N-terminal domain-containing protein [Candidatus Dojkabacteria bacterium]
MSKKFKLLTGSALTAIMALVAPLNAFAIRVQDDFLYEYDTTTSSGEELSGVWAILFFAFICLVIVIAFTITIIWVLSIIDILKRENWKSENDKMVWLLLVIFVNFVAFYYYFFYRKTLDKAGTPGKVEAPSTPTTPVV